MASLADRLRALEGSIGPPSVASPAAAEMMRQDLNRVAGLISGSSRERFANTLARVQEMRPELTPFQQQLEAKRMIVCAAPDGEELWARFEGRRRRES